MTYGRQLPGRVLDLAIPSLSAAGAEEQPAAGGLLPHTGRVLYLAIPSLSPLHAVVLGTRWPSCLRPGCQWLPDCARASLPRLQLWARLCAARLGQDHMAAGRTRGGLQGNEGLQKARGAGVRAMVTAAGALRCPVARGPALRSSRSLSLSLLLLHFSAPLFFTCKQTPQTA